MKGVTLVLLVGTLSVFASATHAEKQAAPEVFAVVNGTPLSMDLYRFLVGSREQERIERQAYESGFDAEMHRQQAAEDLVMTELLAQQATRMGIHETELVKAEMAMAEKTLLAQLYVKRLMNTIEVDESEIRRYYDQQKEQVMYRFMIWQTPDQDRATDILAALKAGKDAGTSEQDIVETPWLLDTDIAPEVNDKVRRLGVNDFAEKPVLQDGVWKVVQVIDRQVMSKQSYEEEREVIKAELARLKLDEKLEKLADDASIVFSE
ncbi:MAG: peptidylprolyl isomerase [Marinobacter sp.]|uniref:peptidylprolyl isomerase n=1 Tax=Marinobacter sp. TaxID=50741 RepID=UPI0032983844